MKTLLATVMIAFLPLSLAAQEEEANGEDKLIDEVIIGDAVRNIEDFRWIKRLVVVFADSTSDPRYVEQMELLTERLEALALRDVVVLTDTDPAEASDLRRALRPRGFMWALVGKDGQVYMRKPVPWTVREITSTIDKMPIRQREMRNRSGAS